MIADVLVNGNVSQMRTPVLHQNE